MLGFCSSSSTLKVWDYVVSLYSVLHFLDEKELPTQRLVVVSQTTSNNIKQLIPGPTILSFSTSAISSHFWGVNTSIEDRSTVKPEKTETLKRTRNLCKWAESPKYENNSHDRNRPSLKVIPCRLTLPQVTQVNRNVQVV